MINRRRRSAPPSDWLTLIEPQGQFLTAPVLRAAFPSGFPAVPSEIRREARERLAALPRSDADPARRDAWIAWLFRDGLGWGERYQNGDAAHDYTRDVPEYRTMLRADGVLLDPESAKPRAFMMCVPFGTAFEKRLPGEEWSATPLDRIGELARAHGVRIGLLTDGERVALVHVPETGGGGHAVWSTDLFAEGAEREYFASFVGLLHAQRFFNESDDKTPEGLFAESTLKQQELTKTLGLQVRRAVELLVGALARADRERHGMLLAKEPPARIYEAAATVMMRLVFLLFAEERTLLPLGDALYAESYAVSTLRDALDADAVRLGDEPLERRATAWRRLLATFAAIYGGIAHDRLRMPAYGGRLFDPARFAFLGRARIDDLTVRAVLTALQTVTLAGEARRLSFLTLDVEQIGHVYEGLLDHGVKRVDDVHLGFDGKSGAESEIALAEVEAVAAKGSPALTSFLAEKLFRSEKSVAKLLDRGEKLAVGGADGAETRRGVMQACESDEGLVRRVLPYAPLLRSDLHGLPTVYAANGLLMTKTRARRDSGTEYTPRELAEEIVLYALRPLCYAPGPADGAPEGEWLVKSSAELLALKICDPACGSGAFLVATCRYLAERVAEAWQHEGRTCDDDPVREAQRLIAERCLYGVDRDPMAVEMAKLSLWLLTFARDRPFGFLDHAVREGDSLLGITSLDQLRHLHLDPERGRSLHGGSLFDATARLDALVEEAVALRVRLEDQPLIDIADAREKARLDDLARQRTYEACVLADALVGVALAKHDRPQRERDAAVLALARDANRALARGAHDAEATAALASIERQAGADLNRGKPTDAPLRRPFHWALEFPEVFRASGQFDCVVGNPPFLGGKFITGRFGTDYRALLVDSIANGRRGHADLVAYFFLRAATIGRCFGFIATNTIAQGDTREVALDELTNDARGWSIVRAERSRPWPGAAAIQVAEVWCAHDSKAETHTLDGAATPGITPGLVPPGRALGNPHRLVANAGIAFQGSVVLGMGFTMSPQEAHALIERDPRNAEVLAPYINAEDICNRPDVSPRRWIVNFHDWTESRATEYVDCYSLISKNVRPERQRRNANGEFALRDPLPMRWWHYADKRPALYSGLLRMSRAIAMPLVSKYSIAVRLTSSYVYAHALAVFTTDSDATYGILTSTVHRAWARVRGSTMRNDSRYTPTDCFETFPLPLRDDASLAATMGQLHDVRAAYMLENAHGITATYNRFHDPSESAAEIRQLRDLHAELDCRVVHAYGWDDLDMTPGFRDTEEGRRYTIADAVRIELLDRLLQLNHDRYRDEVARGLHDAGRRKKPRSNARGGQSPTDELTLLDGLVTA